MENIEVKVAQLEEREKSNTKRIDGHEERIDKLENTYSIMEKMEYRMGKVEQSVENIDKKLDDKVQEDSNKKGAKWDKLVDYIFYFILATILSFIAFKLGLK